MKMKERIACLLAVCLLPGLLSGQELRNDRFSIKVKDSQTIIMSEKGKSVREFKMNFVVLYNPKSPSPGLKMLRRDVRYSTSTWKAADPRNANILKERFAKDPNMVGDGFDDSIAEWAKGSTADIFKSAPSFRISPSGHTLSGDTVAFSFGRHPLFSFETSLELGSGAAYPKLSFKFTPKDAGYYSVGYVGAPACTLSAVDEIWQPLVWQEKRFPRASHVTLAFRCSVPSAFVTEDGVTTGVVADKKEYPFEQLPTAKNSRFAVAVRDAEGNARPILFAPAFGYSGSKMAAGNPFEFTMHLFTTVGDTTKAQEVVARELYGFRDIRNNALGPLNRTIDNMRDYIMSSYSRFQYKYKGCDYSTDAPGAVKNVSSIDPLDLSIVMDDEQMFQQRAYPYMEYMISRGKFLFTVNEKQGTQSPSYRLNGPAAPISELASLYSMFHKATPLFKTLAEKEIRGSRARNLNTVQKGDTWWNALSLYSATGEQRFLDKAIAGADIYLEKRLGKMQVDWKDPDALGGPMFWSGYVPRYMDLLMLYEATGEKRYLDAARTGARRFAQFVYLSPAIPDAEITVNKGGKAPKYWYLARHKQVLVPEESVPAWRLSSMGMMPEGPTTCAGHRATFMTFHAPWMLRIGYLTGDKFLRDIARSGVIGRYRNFPGYHINTARTTAYEKRDFPLCGHKEQSVSSFHYNHIIPMLSMLVDYLVTDTYGRSGGKIDFPYNYSEGYAYMQNKAYGGMKGKFYEHNDAFLWMPKALLEVPDQINYLSARGENDMYVALMNELEKDIKAEIVFNEALLPEVSTAEYRVEIITGKDRSTAMLTGGKLSVPVKGRGLTALIIKKLKVTPMFQNKIADLDESDAWDRDMVDLKEAKGRAMILNLGSANRYAYVFLEYSKRDYKKVELVYTNGSKEKRIEKLEFPWEFTVLLDNNVDRFSFVLECFKPNGKVDRVSPEAVLESLHRGTPGK